MMMNSVDVGQPTGGPKRRKRIITDARKEQNRIAQQQYRKLDSAEPVVIKLPTDIDST